MTPEEIRQRFSPAVDEIVNGCRLTEDFVDKEQFQVMIATVWGNAVLDPARSGIVEGDLENLHDFLNEYVDDIVGDGETITDCYRFIMSKAGQDSLIRQRVTQSHQEFLHYFARLILQGELVEL